MPVRTGRKMFNCMFWMLDGLHTPICHQLMFRWTNLPSQEGNKKTLRQLTEGLYNVGDPTKSNFRASPNRSSSGQAGRTMFNGVI